MSLYKNASLLNVPLGVMVGVAAIPELGAALGEAIVVVRAIVLVVSGALVLGAALGPSLGIALDVALWIVLGLGRGVTLGVGVAL
jgi:hypothetical protein